MAHKLFELNNVENRFEKDTQRNFFEHEIQKQCSEFEKCENLVEFIKPKGRLEEGSFEKATENFKCVICLSPFEIDSERNKKCAKCIATYCSLCFDRVKTQYCSVCKSSKLSEAISAPKLDLDKVLDYSTSCPHCKTEMTAEELHEHFRDKENCTMRTVKCPFDETEFLASRKDEHFETCTRKKVRCKLCFKLVCNGLILSHDCNQPDYSLPAKPHFTYPRNLNRMIP